MSICVGFFVNMRVSILNCDNEFFILQATFSNFQPRHSSSNSLHHLHYQPFLPPPTLTSTPTAPLTHQAAFQLYAVSWARQLRWWPRSWTRNCGRTSGMPGTASSPERRVTWGASGGWSKWVNASSIIAQTHLRPILFIPCTHCCHSPICSFQRPMMVILDRNFDLATPLHHTWTYQALAHDVLVRYWLILIIS